VTTLATLFIYHDEHRERCEHDARDLFAAWVFLMLHFCDRRH
jgi:hypothetical protein